MQNDSFRYEYVSDGVEITGYVGYPVSLTIPDFIDDKRVIGIGEKAFLGCLTLTDIVLQEGIKYLSAFAFKGCNNLKNILLPKSLRKIARGVFSDTASITHPSNKINDKIYISGHLIKCVNAKGKVAINGCLGVADEAFKECRDITELVFFDGIKYIGDFAFCHTSVRDISIPDGVERIGDHAFANSPFLSSARFGKGLAKIGEGIFYDTPLWEKDELIVDSYFIYSRRPYKKLKIAQNITLLADGAFANSDIKTVVLPSSVKNLPDACFFGCKELISVKGAVESIGDGAFAYCKNLILSPTTISGEKAFYKSGIDPKSQDDEPIYVAKRLISAKEVYGEYYVKEGTLQIFDGAFADNVKLVKLFMPDSVYQIGKACFKNCKNLTFASLSKNLKELPKQAFKNCVRLAECNSLGVTSVWDECFAECEKLSFFDLSKTKSVGKESFTNCRSLTGVDLERTEHVGERAFERTGITALNTRCKDIRKYAFAYSRSLRKIEISVDVPEGCFYACQSLKEVKFDKEKVKVGAKAFALCGSLTDIDTQNLYLAFSSFENSGLKTLKTNAKVIPFKCFKGCSSLKVVELPFAERIEKQAFDGCLNVEELVSDKVSFIGEDNFNNCKIAKLRLTGGVKIDKNTFSDCRYLQEVVVDGNGAGSIDERAFVGCSNLYKVSLNSITNVSKKAFSSCEKLSELSMPNVTAIGDECFSGSNLKEVELPDSLKRIGKNVFYGINVKASDFIALLKEENGTLLKFAGDTVFYKHGRLVIPFFDESCYFDETWMKRSLSAYDRIFAKDLDDKTLKLPYVKSRLLYPYKLSLKNKKAFLAEYFEEIAEQSIKERSLSDVLAFCKYDYFDKENIKPLIELSSRLQAVEITSALLANLKKKK